METPLTIGKWKIASSGVKGGYMGVTTPIWGLGSKPTKSKTTSRNLKRHRDSGNNSNINKTPGAAPGPRAAAAAAAPAPESRYIEIPYGSGIPGRADLPSLCHRLE